MISFIMNKNFKKIVDWAKPIRNQAGFTLIEMIAAIVLLGIMGLFSTQFISGAAESNRLVSGQKALVDDAKLAMEFMIRELRVASEDLTNISLPSSTSITFDKYSALTVDTDTTQINYNLVGTNIVRTSSNATTTLASQINTFSITKSGNVYTITMILTGSNGESFTLTSAVQPRGSI
ncbi:MAG: prepilin-type N-terminal cleavage/methylation domain-containing protein [Nitrospinae bacterium]|nr:prepilin-type N-terminal cleavage/methylation domain-containing protein [Nitrospinota bacterium]